MRIAFLPLATMILCAAPASPRLVLDATTHAFGTVARGVRVVHRFKVTNGGSAPLRILRLNASCGCTSTVLGRKELAPGEATELEVTFNTDGFHGPVRKTLEVLSDDPVEPSRTLTLEADVTADVTPTNAEFFFADLTPRDRRKTSLKIKSETGRPVFATNVDMSEAPWLGVATRTVGRNLFVDLELLAKNLPGDQTSGTDTLAVHVENPKVTVVHIRVRWEKRSATPRK